MTLILSAIICTPKAFFFKKYYTVHFNLTYYTVHFNSTYKKQCFWIVKTHE